MDLILPIILLGFFLYNQSIQPVLLRDFSYKVFDMYQKIKPRKFDISKSMVRILDIDEESLGKVGQWPWPRVDIAKIVYNLSIKGAAVIAFDVVFSEPDQSSLEQVIKRMPQESANEIYNRFVKGKPTNDELLAEYIRLSERVVTGYSFLSENQMGNGDPVLKRGLGYSGDKPHRFLRDFKRAVVNLPIFDESAVGSGSFSVEPDSDGIIRRIPLLFSYNGKIYPSLAAETLRVAQGGKGSIRVRSSGASSMVDFKKGQRGISTVRIGRLSVPTDKKGHILLFDAGMQKELYLPAWKAIDGSIEEKDVAGKIIFVGTSAAGLKDIRATALSPLVAGVEIHAQIVDQMVTQTFLKRPVWSSGLELIFIFVLGLTIIILNHYVRAIYSAALCIVSIAFGIGVSWYFYDKYGLLFDAVYPSMTILFTWISGTIILYIRVENERAEVRGAFSRYLSPDLVESLAKSPEKLQLGGEMRELTLLFCDIRGFTPISEQFDPQGLTRFINRFLTPMTEIIMEHNGTIDKYMGDCIMAFWNAPVHVQNHQRFAVDSALKMITRLRSHNQLLEEEAEQEGRKFIPIRVGIGLNTGSCCVGNMGSNQRFDYSVLGDTVNLASRLEGQSKSYGITIVIGESTYASVSDYACLDLDKIIVKGKMVPVQIYTVLGDSEMANTPEFQGRQEQHNLMIMAYRSQNWGEAVRICTQLQADHDDTALLYQMYHERIKDFQINSPGEAWDGVYTATSK